MFRILKEQVLNEFLVDELPTQALALKERAERARAARSDVGRVGGLMVAPRQKHRIGVQV